MSEEMNGYNGKILRVNLSNSSITIDSIDDKFCRKYLGGAGFIAYYLWKELKPGIDALSPDNKLLFALGPVSGLVVPGASRNCIGAKSPLTGGIAKSEVGGFWMAELKRAGFDAIIIEGKAEKPVYLWIQDGQVSIRDAGHLWGKETLETERAIRSELEDERIQVAFVGQGGENMVRFACIMEGCHDAAGRGGLGAVMGSKKLKAIAVRGHNLPPVFNADKVKEIRQQLTHPSPISDFGTGGPYMVAQEATGDLPIRNFRDGGFPEVNMIHGGVIKDTVRVGMEGCFACPLRCKKVIKFDEPYQVDQAYGGPEYETLAALGSNCGISDLKAIIKGNERCNAYSLDTISAGASIAFAMECYEYGLITSQDTGGIELKWGDAGVMLDLLELIAQRKGIGDFLAEGTARMAQKIGKGSHDFAMHVKGLEAGMHEPRVGSALFLSFMLSPTGADHCVTTPDGLLANEMMFSQFHALGWLEPPSPTEINPRKVSIFKDSQLQNLICDSLVVCQFPGITADQIVELLKGVTGWDTGLTEIMRIGERITTLMRLFNLREGITEADDKLPERYYQPTQGGPLADLKIDKDIYEKARKYYYVLMGWDANGVPLPEKVEELGIN
ncbi:MAG: aldehyde ferredoxin oxidoreductase family protein [Methyloversatilis sp.]|jgi:aldehyde:ferredoxin oxidoreductase|nr:aldehyde ferredoxin oxidoreductase family protein [Methyloversatilis sp.]